MKKSNYLLILMFVMLSQLTFGQGINIFDIDTTNYPTIKAKFYAYDKDGKIQRPTKDQLKIIENGTERKIIDVSCPVKLPIAISSVLTFDVSGSMSGGNLDLAKTAAKSWIDALPTKESQAAITSFNEQNYIIQDFTKEKNKLLSAIEKLKPQGGTDYNKGFIEPMGGGILMAKTGKFKKVLIFLTDGQPNFEPDVQKIIDETKINNITIFAVTLGMTCPQNLRDISLNTDGYWYENVTTLQEAKNVYLEIMRKVQDDPCDISWESDMNCSLGMTKLEIKYQQYSQKLEYFSPQSSIINLEFSPKFNVVFKNKEIGKSYDTTITIKAINSNVEINNISSSNSQFEINPKSFKLSRNETKDLTITYSPIENKYNFTKFEFTNAQCKQTFTSSAYTNRVKNNSIKLTHPNGGEVFVVGSDTIITWEGISDNELVKLEYSIDNGLKWKDVDTSRNLSYSWKQIPFPTTDSCIVRVNQLEDRIINNKDTIRTLTNDKNISVDNIIYSPDGKAIISNNIVVWELERESLLLKMGFFYNLSINRTIYSPDGSLIATYGAGVIGLWDPSDFSLIRTFNICEKENAWVKEIKFSPDGIFIGFICQRDFKLLNLITGIVENNVIDDYLWSNDKFEFSPDGSKLLTWSLDLIKLNDLSTGGFYYKIFPQNESNNFRSVAFNSNGNNFASGDDEGNIKIWDVLTGDLIRTIKAHNESVEEIVYNQVGNQIASVSRDKTVKLWDAETGDLIKSHSEHSNIVKCVVFSSDGNTIYSGSADGSIKLWEINIPRIQSDQSDNVFSIVAPEVKARDIDMKKQLVGTVKDSVIIGFIENIGTYKCRIDSIYFEGEQFDEFQLVSGIPVFTVDVSKNYNVEFRFKPKSFGIRKSTIVIITQADTLRYNIVGEGIQPMVQVLNNFIDFGKVIVNENKDSLQAQTIKNVGTSDLLIKSIYQYGPNLKDFKEINEVNTYNLKSGEELKLDLSFKPTYLGRTSGTLMFEYEGVGSPAVVQLFGEGISNNPNCDGRGFVFDNFSSKSKVFLVGNAEFTQDSTIQLTSNKSNQVGGVTYGERLALRSSFEMYFSFRMSNGDNNQFIDGSLPGADGFAVLFQNGKNFRTTEKGGSLGFNGIENCVALEIDMYKNDNEFFDPNGNHVAFQVPKDNIITAEHNASRTVGMNDKIFVLRPDSTIYYGKLVYNAETKQIQFFLDSTNKYNNLVLSVDNFDFSQYLQLELGDFAHIGITSTTGAATQVHELLSWEFCSDRDEFLSVKDKYYESEEVKQYDNILKLESGIIKEIQIIDITGKILLSKDINDNNINLEELGISTGIYFVILIDEENRSHFRKINVVK